MNLLGNQEKVQPTMASRELKYQGINKIKEISDLCSENLTPGKEIKYTRRWKDFFCSRLTEPISLQIQHNPARAFG